MSLNFDDYYKLNNYIPVSGGTSNLSYNECKTKCNNDKNCKYFYSYQKKGNPTANHCLTNSDSYFPNQLMPKVDSNIINASLNVRNKNVNLSTNDYRSKINNEITYSYDSYKDYQLLDEKPLIIDNPVHGLNNSFQNNYNNCKKYYIGKEGFDNHGYTNSSTVLADNDIIGNIMQKQIQPMIAISQDFGNLQGNISNNYYDISSQIYKITNSSNTGVRDILSSDANDAYDYSGNTLKFNSKKPRKEDALKDDVNIMILEQNNLLMLGTITIASLLIAAIYFGRE
jgi:hypothetical protein